MTRPVAALVGGMRRAKGGELGARVALAGGGEFAFLGGALDRMLARLEELTAGLEARVRQATADLAEKNRELQGANEQLWQAQLEIGRSERLAALGQLAATIAHELGTPLNSILGYTQLLRRETLLPEQTEKLAIVESQVRRVIETIRSVLDRPRPPDRPRARGGERPRPRSRHPDLDPAPEQRRPHPDRRAGGPAAAPGRRGRGTPGAAEPARERCRRERAQRRGGRDRARCHTERPSRPAPRMLQRYGMAPRSASSE